MPNGSARNLVTSKNNTFKILESLPNNSIVIFPVGHAYNPTIATIVTEELPGLANVYNSFTMNPPPQKANYIIAAQHPTKTVVTIFLVCLQDKKFNWDLFEESFSLLADHRKGNKFYLFSNTFDEFIYNFELFEYDLSILETGAEICIIYPPETTFVIDQDNES